MVHGSVGWNLQPTHMFTQTSIRSLVLARSALYKLIFLIVHTSRSLCTTFGLPCKAIATKPFGNELRMVVRCPLGRFQIRLMSVHPKPLHNWHRAQNHVAIRSRFRFNVFFSPCGRLVPVDLLLGSLFEAIAARPVGKPPSSPNEP